jgi:tetratricopeptide (TPR) repeat protein
MTRKGKVTLFVGVGIIGLVLIGLAFHFMANSRYSRQIPEIPQSGLLTEPVIEQISSARKKAKRNPSSDNLGMLGMVYHSSANYEEASICYQLAVEKDEQEWQWQYYLGYLYAEMSQSALVLDNFNRVIELNPDAYHAWYYCGEEYMNQGDFEQAEKYFSKIRDVKKSQVQQSSNTRTDRYGLGTYAGFQLSNIYFNTGQLDLAEKTLEGILLGNRTFGPAYRLLGNVYRTRGDADLSRHYIAAAGDQTPFSPPVDTLVDRLSIMSRSELYLLKKIDEAINAIYSDWALKLINQGIKYMPDSKYLTSKAIKTCLWLNRDDQAITYVDTHISKSLDDVNELFFMAKSFYDKNLYAYALRYWMAALELSPGNAEIQKKMAICYWHMGEQQKSLDLLDEVLIQNVNDLEVLADVADIIYFDLGAVDKARGYLVMLQQLNPSNPKVQKIMASEAERRGDIRSTIRLYESSFSGNPEDLTTVRNLTRLLFNQKNWSKVIGHLRKALAHHPNEPYILERLGTILIFCPDPALRNESEGMVYAERAFVHNLSGPRISIAAGRSLALAYAGMGDKKAAGTVMNSTLEIARQANVPRENISELENYARMLQNMSPRTEVVN